MKYLIALLISVATSVGAQTAEPVKMSVNSVCHAPGTKHYNRTKNFTAYDTIEECLAAGGRLSK